MFVSFEIRDVAMYLCANILYIIRGLSAPRCTWVHAQLILTTTGLPTLVVSLKILDLTSGSH